MRLKVTQASHERKKKQTNKTEKRNQEEKT